MTKTIHTKTQRDKLFPFAALCEFIPLYFPLLLIREGGKGVELV